MSVTRRSDRPGKWRARYRGPDGKERSKTVDRKIDGDNWIDDQKTKVATHTWTDPSLGKVTVGTWGEKWLATKAARKLRTYRNYQALWKLHVEPRWGTTVLSKVTYEAVAEWVAELSASGKSASLVRKIHQVLYNLLEFAVRARRIPTNPAAGVELPAVTAKPPMFLSAAQVEAFAEAVGEHYAPLIYFLSYTGCRWGEAIALRKRHVDLLRRRVSIEATFADDGGRLVPDTPKDHQHRSVPLPAFLADLLTTRLAALDDDSLVFTTESGHMLRLSNFRHKTFDPARTKAGLPDTVTPHKLRHTAASLAIGAGASVKAVQKMLGHKSATMTLDIYGHLYEDELDALAGRLHDARAEVRDAPVVRIKEQQ